MIAELAALLSSASWVAPLGRVLLDFLWQGTAIGLGAWLILASLRNARPQTRYGIACAALVACLIAPLSAFWRSETMPSDSALATTAAIASTAPHDIETPRSIVDMSWVSSIDTGLPWVVAIWSLGVALMLLRLIAGALWVHRLRAEATAAIDARMLQRFEALRIRMRVSPMVRLRALTDDAVALASPIAAGVIAPVVILPAALLARMPSDLLEALIAHELAHIRRHDYLINLLQTVIEALLFYHPVVWWLSRRIRYERELVADDLAAQALGAPRTLAVALAELDRIHAECSVAAPHVARFPLALSQAAHGGLLMSRIQRLVQSKRPSVGIGFALPLVGLTAIGLACFAYAQSNRPQAQQTLVSAQRTPSSHAVAIENARPLPAPAITSQQAQSGVAGFVVNGKLDIDARDGTDREGYALVRKDKDGFAISGSLEDIEDIRAAKSRIEDDFMWFRRDGKAYVVRDPATLARVREIWRASESNEAKMRVLSAEMETKSEAVHALAERVSAQTAERAMQEANIAERIAQIRNNIAAQQLTQQQAELARQQAEIDARYAENPVRNKREYERESAALEAQQEALESRMEALEADMQAKGAKVEAEMEAKVGAMENELEARLESATRPLEALGAQLEALGDEQERIMSDVDREVSREIDRALREKLVEPAPGHDAKQ